MPFSVAPQYTQRDSRWTDWKVLQQMKRLVYQMEDDGVVYTIWGYDGPEVHICTIWKGTVPDSITPVYSQAQNDADKEDFEGHWKAGANKTVEQRATDGSLFTSPCIFPAGVYLYITSSGDGSGIGDGPAFLMSSEAIGDTTLEFSFLDWVLMAGGASFSEGAQRGDWASFEVYCPATAVTPNAEGTGNCNVVNNVVIVPAAGNGAFDVDLALANPILTPLKDGFWEWDFPLTGKGSVSVGDPGKAGAHLLTVDKPLVRFANRIQLMGNGERNFSIPAIEPKIMLPHWKGKVTLHNAGHTGLAMCWHLLVSRTRTV